MTSRGELSCWSGPQLTVGTSVCQRLKILQMYGLFHCVCVAHAMMLHAHVHARFFSCHGFRTRHVHSYITCLSCMHDVSSHVPRCHLHDGSMFMFVLVHELWFVFHIDVYVFWHVVTCSCWFFSWHGRFMFTTLMFCHVHSGSWS